MNWLTVVTRIVLIILGISSVYMGATSDDRLAQVLFIVIGVFVIVVNIAFLVRQARSPRT